MENAFCWQKRAGTLNQQANQRKGQRKVPRWKAVERHSDGRTGKITKNWEKQGREEGKGAAGNARKVEISR